MHIVPMLVFHLISLASIYPVSTSKYHLYSCRFSRSLGSTVAGAYTDLSRPTRMIFDLPSSEENALTSIYEELHEYEEMELVPNF